MFKQMKVWLALTTIFSLLALVSSCSKSATNEGVTNDSAATGKTFPPGDGSITGVIF